MILSVREVITVWLTGVTGDPVSNSSDNWLTAAWLTGVTGDTVRNSNDSCLVDGGHW